jgi:hypothetical protein
MRRRDERVIEALVKVARPTMLNPNCGPTPQTAWSRDSCIAGTRIGVLALAEFGIRAHPIGVSIIVLNAAYRALTAQLGHVPEPHEYADTNAHSLGLGVTWNEPEGADMGHFALAIGARLMVDLTIDQATRLGKGLVFDEPIVANMPPGWKKGGERLWTHRDEYSIGIQAEPANKNFVRSRDWTDLARTRRTTRLVVEAMRRELAA